MSSVLCFSAGFLFGLSRELEETQFCNSNLHRPLFSLKLDLNLGDLLALFAEF